MATVKLGTLLIRTLAKPISAQIKNQAKQHERFREICVNLAQATHRTEVKLRTGLLGEQAKHIRPLSETKAIENGANALAEGFLFAVAAALILGETYRSSRSQSKRRDDVDERLHTLTSQVQDLTNRLDTVNASWESRLEEEQARNDELTRILGRVVEIGLRGGWMEFEDTPLQLPRVEFTSAAGTSTKLPDGTSKSSKKGISQADVDALKIDTSSTNTDHPASSSSN